MLNGHRSRGVAVHGSCRWRTWRATRCPRSCSLSAVWASSLAPSPCGKQPSKPPLRPTVTGHAPSHTRAHAPLRPLASKPHASQCILAMSMSMSSSRTRGSPRRWFQEFLGDGAPVLLRRVPARLARLCEERLAMAPGSTLFQLLVEGGGAQGRAKVCACTLRCAGLPTAFALSHLPRLCRRRMWPMPYDASHGMWPRITGGVMRAHHWCACVAAGGMGLARGDLSLTARFIGSYAQRATSTAYYIAARMQVWHLPVVGRWQRFDRCCSTAWLQAMQLPERERKGKGQHCKQASMHANKAAARRAIMACCSVGESKCV